MHYHLEIVMPPVDNVAEAISQIMAPFKEEGEGEDMSSFRFWDFYVIGGRWAGHHLETTLGQDRIDALYAKLNDMGVTVSGLQAGKQSIQPESQIPAVDALWVEMFPDTETKVCPLFSHYNNQYKHSTDYPDVVRFGDMPMGLKAEGVIIAGPSYMDDGTMQAKTFLTASIWNGVCHQKTEWNGTMAEALNHHADNYKSAVPDHKAKHTPTADWLVVTVDYHS